MRRPSTDGRGGRGVPLRSRRLGRVGRIIAPFSLGAQTSYRSLRDVSVWDDAHETLHLDLSPHADALDEKPGGGFPS